MIYFIIIIIIIIIMIIMVLMMIIIMIMVYHGFNYSPCCQRRHGLQPKML
jgi:hypothetical protein